MQYMGGKARIAKDLARVMLAIAPQRSTYLEPFLGGCHVLPLMAPHFDLSIASDVMPDVAMLWRDALSGAFVPPTEVTREQYAELRHAPPSALRGFVGFGCSFGGKWFGGYATNARGRRYEVVASRGVERKLSTIDASRTVIREQDYREHSPAPGTIVYCDPPYAGTTTYKDAPPWDAELFWKTMGEWVTAGAMVFVSEYAAPDGWVSVWTKTANVGSLKKDGNADPVTEHLFMHASQAPTTIPTSTPAMTGDKVSTTEETRLMLERKDAARRAALDAAQDATNDLGPYDGGHYQRMAKALHAAALVIAESWRAEAISFEGSSKRDQSAKVRQRLRDSAAELVGFTAGLVQPSFLASLDKQDTDSGSAPDLMSALRASIPVHDAASVHANLVHEVTEPARGAGETQLTAQRRPAWAGLAVPADESEWYGVVRECKIGGHACQYDDATREWAPMTSDLAFTPCSTGGCQPGQPWHESPQVDNREAIQSYLKGDTDVIPTGQTITIADPNAAEVQRALIADGAKFNIAGNQLVFVDPAPLAPPRMEWDQFAEEVANLPIPDHGSFSAITDLADCGMKYALGKLAKAGQVKPEPPAWYLVGGTAFHSTIETIERSVMTHGNLASDFDAGNVWRSWFATEIAKEEQLSGVPQALWRASDKGKENYDWWRVQGEDMVRRYVQYHSPEWRNTHQILVMPDGRPALELELTLDLAGWPFVCRIDQAWMTPAGIEIVDPKSGKTKQPSTFQLGGYAHALAVAMSNGNYLAGGPNDENRFTIAGAFYDARAGSYDLEVPDLLKAHPLAELKHRAFAARAQVQNRAYLPRVSNFGGGCTSCGFRALCPAQS